MRASVVILVSATALGGCLATSIDTDGTWSPFDRPCVSVGAQRELAESRFSVLAVPAGDTLLYSGGQTVSQLDLATGDSRVVLRSDSISEFGWIDDDIVYYEGDGARDGSSPIDLIIDHGARSTSRYQRISPRRSRFQAGLVTTRAGIYWWTSDDGNIETAEHWRYDPETGSVEPFPLEAASVIARDDTSFFFFDRRNRLVIRAQRPGPPDVVVDLDPELPVPAPLGIDGDEVFYVRYSSPELDGELVARAGDGTERTLVTGNIIVGGAIDPTYVYFTVDCGVQDGGSFDERCQNVYRVPRAGGPIETYFAGDTNTAAFGVTIDRCNVYWQQFRLDGSSVYGRGITP